MSIVVAVDRETTEDARTLSQTLPIQPYRLTERRKIEGLTHADLADTRRGIITFTRNSQCLSGPVVAPQKM
jgi:hypothetical protein